MQRFLLAIPILLVAVAAAGCGAVQPPPLALSHRDSLLGAGKVVLVKNTSNEELRGVEMRFTAPSGEERRYDQATLAPYGSFEVGWKKLGGWEIPEGAEIEVRCEGYLRSAAAKIE